MNITVVIPTYNPDLNRLYQTLLSLQKQSLDSEKFCVILVDNNSESPVDEVWCRDIFKGDFNIVFEPELGLTKARLAGVKNTNTDLIVFCDDDNVLCPHYLANAYSLSKKYPRVGAAGGKNKPVFDVIPPSWFSLGIAPLGCRDLGDESLIFTAEKYKVEKRYDECSPIGAGMVMRKEAISHWIAGAGSSPISDRKGDELSSAGDCDLVLYVLDSGWDVAYWPELELDHLISESRMTKEYLGKVSRCAYRDFIKVLDSHSIRPWSSINVKSMFLYKIKSWCKYSPWKSPISYIKYQSSLGHYEGRAALSREIQ